MESYETVHAFDPEAEEGTIVRLAGDGKLYKLIGGAWNEVVPDGSGGFTSVLDAPSADPTIAASQDAGADQGDADTDPTSASTSENPDPAGSPGGGTTEQPSGSDDQPSPEATGTHDGETVVLDADAQSDPTETGDGAGSDQDTPQPGSSADPTDLEDSASDGSGSTSSDVKDSEERVSLSADTAPASSEDVGPLEDCNAVAHLEDGHITCDFKWSKLPTGGTEFIEEPCLADYSEAEILERVCAELDITNPTDRARVNLTIE